MAVAAAVAAASSGCGGSSRGQGEGGPPPTVVQVVTTEAEELPVVLAAVGTLDSSETTTVAAEIRGLVVELDVPEGRRVDGGHVLARLDDAERRAAVAVARARLKNTRQRVERLRSLRASSVGSEQALDDAETESEAAQGALDEAETLLRKTVIRAPFPGILGLRDANKGQYLEPGDAVVSLTQVHPLELTFAVPQRHAPDLATGQRVLGTVGECGARFEGRVGAIEPRVDPATRTVRLEAEIPNPDGGLLPGMAVRVRLITDTVPDAIVVPREAIIRLGSKHIVYVVDGEGRARQREVQLGTFFADGVHVRTGLEPGQEVVVAGHQKLRPGSPTAPEPYVPIENPNLELGWRGPAADCEA